MTLVSAALDHSAKAPNEGCEAHRVGGSGPGSLSFVRPTAPYDDVKAPKKPKEQKPVKAINAKTGGHRFPDLVCEPLRVFLRGLPCILAGRVDRDGNPHVCRGRIVVCHKKTRGSSGPDLENTFPGCEWGAHQDQEGHTKEFEYQWKLRLKIECRRYTSLFLDTVSGKKWKHQQAGKDRSGA